MNNLIDQNNHVAEDSISDDGTSLFLVQRFPDFWPDVRTVPALSATFFHSRWIRI
jgi:hypothetical protein